MNFVDLTPLRENSMGVLQEFKLKDYATLTGILMGFFIIMFVVIYKATLFASFCIFIGIVLDFLDGYIARKTKQINELGKQLDSLSDSFVFGVAPAVIAFVSFTDQPTRMGINGLPGWLMFIACFIFIIGAISRLAWFNLSTNEGYSGLPTPLSAAFVALTIAADILAYEINYSPNWFNYAIHYAMPFILIGLAWLNVTDMVSYGKNIRKKSGKLKYLFVVLFCAVIGLLIASMFNFPFREECLFTGICILWLVLIGFILYGFFDKSYASSDRKESLNPSSISESNSNH